MLSATVATIIIVAALVGGYLGRRLLGDKAPDWLPQLGPPSLGPGAWDSRLRDAKLPRLTSLEVKDREKEQPDLEPEE